MIQDKYIDLYARNSGLRDKLIAERDVVLIWNGRSSSNLFQIQNLSSFFSFNRRSGSGTLRRRVNLISADYDRSRRAA